MKPAEALDLLIFRARAHVEEYGTQESESDIEDAIELLRFEQREHERVVEEQRGCYEVSLAGASSEVASLKARVKALEAMLRKAVPVWSTWRVDVDALLAEARKRDGRSDLGVAMNTFQPWRKFQPDTDGDPHGWIQWKGTAVCLDFHCKCGAHGHVDDEFCYYVKCGKCGQIYELSGHVEAHPVDVPNPPTFEPRLTEVDELSS